MKHLKCIVSILLLIGFATAIDEITTQNVKMGDYIKQYAIVNILKDNGAYYP